MTDEKTWSEIADRLDAVGLKLKLHLEEARDGDLAGTLRPLRDKVEEAFEATGRTVKDEAVREDVREVGRLLADAVANLLTRMSTDVRDTLGHRGRDG